MQSGAEQAPVSLTCSALPTLLKSHMRKLQSWEVERARRPDGWMDSALIAPLWPCELQDRKGKICWFQIPEM